MSLDLQPRHLAIVRSILHRRLPDLRVLVYGSRARGDSRPHSDLDLLLDSSESVAEAVLAELDLDFAESDLPFRVQIVDGSRVDPDFRRQIASDLRVINEGQREGTVADPLTEVRRDHDLDGAG